VTVLLAVSEDFWGARAEEIAESYSNVCVAVDRSGGLGRALRLVARGSIPLPAAMSIFVAAHSLPTSSPKTSQSFRSNPELRDLAASKGASHIVLFRAGLIISGTTIEGYKVTNVHCADINGFGGLASIWRALRSGAFKQCATLHEVTCRIDEGNVLDTEPYLLDQSSNYAKNEYVAYQAGLRLLDRALARAQREQ
jgi:folate-dependent phosphoribosylglycinamide formyltransferase PurN